MRLRDLGIVIGDFAPGPHNAITDVEGVSVGMVDIDDGGLYTGITAVIPYPVDREKRRLCIGRWGLDGWDGFTGLGVAEDFGTFSSPILLAPSPATGRLYDGLIGHGLDRDSGLSTVAGWPPVVVGVDAGPWNEGRRIYEQIGEKWLTRALEGARSGKVAEGNAGIGRGLCAFGLKGGVGSASRMVEGFRLGVLVAAGAGERNELRIDGFPIAPFLPEALGAALPKSFAAVVATDAPLLPRQLDRLAGRTALGLARVGLLDATSEQGLVLAFSTSTIFRGAGDGEATEGVRSLGDAALLPVFAAAAEAVEEGAINGLLAAGRVAGRNPEIAPLPVADWPDAVRRFQKERGL